MRLPRRFSAVPGHAPSPGLGARPCCCRSPPSADRDPRQGPPRALHRRRAVLPATVIAALVGGLGPALLAAGASGAAAQLLLHPAPVHLHHLRTGERHRAGGHGAGGGPRRPRRRPRRTPRPAGRAGPDRGRPARLVLPHRARPQRPAAPAAGADPGGVRPHSVAILQRKERPLDGLRGQPDRRGAPAPRTPMSTSRSTSTSTWSVEGRALAASDRRLLEAVAGQALLALRHQQISAEAAEASAAPTPPAAQRAAVGRRPRPAHPARLDQGRRRQPAGPEPAAVRGRPQELAATVEESADRLTGAGRQPARLVPARHRRCHAGAAARRLRRGRRSSPCAGSTARNASGSISPTTSRRSSPTPACSSGSSPTWSTTPCATRRTAPGRRARQRQADRVEMRVVDRGPGVPPSGTERLFAPFQRLGDREPRGLGLGLSVARGFTEAMGGTLSADDTPGGGLTMVVACPRRPARHPSPLPPPNPPSSRRDPRPGRRRRAALAARAGDQPRAPAATRWSPPPTARTALPPRPPHPPDVVVLDLGLPDLDGIEVIAGLRGWTHVPIIVLSARTDCRRQGARRSTPAPTTTSPSRSASTNCWPASAPPSGGRTTVAGRTSRVVKPATSRSTSPRKPGRRGRATTSGSRPPSGSMLEVLARNPGKLVTQRQLLTEIWGPGDAHRDQLPARLHRPAAPQARSRPGRPRHLHHRSRAWDTGSVCDPASRGVCVRESRGLRARVAGSDAASRVVRRSEPLRVALPASRLDRIWTTSRSVTPSRGAFCRARSAICRGLRPMSW